MTFKGNYMAKKPSNLIGLQFGRLTVVHGPIRKQEGKPFYWDCLCECGKTVTVRGKNLRYGHTQSCGCLRKEVVSRPRNNIIKPESIPVHKKVRLYRIWEGMRARCNNPNKDGFKYYGGRGIKVCPEWDSYEIFEEWAYSHGYREYLTIDRINNDKGYSPDNCRWATWKEQAANKRTAPSLDF